MTTPPTDQAPSAEDPETERHVAAWQDARARVHDLVAGLDAETLERRVPACPAWTVRDLLSHMVGLGADVLGGDEPDDHNEAWTRAQVEARRGRTASDLLAEWADLAPALADWMREHGTRPLNDVVIHEQDLRGAVGVPDGRGSEGLLVVRERMAGRLATAAEDLPPLALVEDLGDGRDGWRWATRGEVDDAAVVVRASGFDLARALTSRRTAEELRAWTVRGDVTAHLGAFAGLGPLPESPLLEHPGG